jgi:hypothetical protein
MRPQFMTLCFFTIVEVAWRVSQTSAYFIVEVAWRVSQTAEYFMYEVCKETEEHIWWALNVTWQSKRKNPVYVQCPVAIFTFLHIYIDIDIFFFFNLYFYFYSPGTKRPWTKRPNVVKFTNPHFDQKVFIQILVLDHALIGRNKLYQDWSILPNSSSEWRIRFSRPFREAWRHT